MHTFLFLFEIDTLIAGATYRHLPLHCTLLPWFDTEMSPGELLERLGKVFKGAPPLELVSDKPELFGKSANIPVHVLKKETALMALHEALVGELRSLGVRIHPIWSGKNYNPHVTTHGAKSFPPGSRKVVSQVSLIKAVDGHSTRKKVLHKRILLG